MNNESRIVCGGGTWFDAPAAPAGTFDSVSVAWDHACGVWTDRILDCRDMERTARTHLQEACSPTSVRGGAVPAASG